MFFFFFISSNLYEGVSRGLRLVIIVVSRSDKRLVLMNSPITDENTRTMTVDSDWSKESCV